MTSITMISPDRVKLKYVTTDEVSDDHEDLLSGLRERPVRIPSRYSYDDLGSNLYEERIRQPEYYQLNLEQELLRKIGADIKEHSFRVICELGAGSTLKICLLIKAMDASGRSIVYCPIDVNASVLRTGATELAAGFPSLSVEALVGTYEQGLAALTTTRRNKLFLFLGSTVGNLEDDEIVRLLQLVGTHCNAGDSLLITADLKKEPKVALNAYCDAAGIGARMELNVLTAMNKQFGADFDLSNFVYRPVYDTSHDRVEARLVSLCGHSVDLPNLNTRLHLRKGDVVRTDIMRKFPRSDLERTFTKAGCSITKSWFDRKGWYGAFLLNFPKSPWKLD